MNLVEFIKRFVFGVRRRQANKQINAFQHCFNVQTMKRIKIDYIDMYSIRCDLLCEPMKYSLSFGAVCVKR